MYYATTYLSPVGCLTLACDGEGEALAGLWMQGQKYYGASVSGPMTAKDDISLFGRAKKWLDSYFAGERPGLFALPLAPAGSGFRQDVWRILREIPYGEVTTYGSIAKKIAEKAGRESMSGQAVGGAVAHNPISIIIPCHRVIGSDGSLTGYAGGIPVKIKLLRLEGAELRV